MPVNDSKQLRGLDPWIVGATIVLLIIGLLAVFSATKSGGPAQENNFVKQIAWVALGLVVASIVVMTPMKFFQRHAYTIYGISLALLVLVLFIGGGQGGVHRWFILGPVRFQPSELAKIATLFALAAYLSNDPRDLSRLRDVVTALGLAAMPMALVAKEPDLGTALVFAAPALPMMFWAGMSRLTVFLFVVPILTLVAAFNYWSFSAVMLLIVGVLVLSKRSLRVTIPNFVLNVIVGIVSPAVWDHLHEYQQNRILTFLGLKQDPKGLGYQVLQSKVAIGSGGFTGKGLTHGTQTQLRFLPEQHTDFIFSVVGEEGGFLAVLTVLAAFFVLLWRALDIAFESRNRFSGLVVIGAAVLILFQVVVNIGMTAGIMPVTGLPLPFLSYGGSSMVSNMVLIGLILNAGRRRFEY